MKFTRKQLAAAVAVLLVVAVLGALVVGGGDDHDDGVATAADGTTSTTSNVAGATETTTAGTATTSTTGDGSETTAPPATVPQPATPPPPAPPGAKFIAPGTYTYDVTGRSRSTLSGEQPVDTDSKLTVDPPSGADQHSRATTEQTTTDTIIRMAADGAYLAALTVTSSVSTMEYKPNPPVLAMPLPLEPRRDWTWAMVTTDGKQKITAELRAVRKEAKSTGDGRSVETVVIEADLMFDGDIEGRQQQIQWFDLEHRVAIQTYERLSVVYKKSVTIESETTSVLRSLTPS